GGTAVIGALAAFLGTLFGFSVGMMAFGGTGAAFGITAAFLAAIIALVVYPISFFIGAGVLFLMPKLFGGQGTDFMTHSYLLSLSYAPLRSIAAVLEIIPIIGALLGGIARLWQAYQAGLAIEAYHKLDRTKAQLSVWIPVGIVTLFTLLSYLGTYMAVSRFGR
ncbi:MAG TPA: YIP1 family protein, partial [Chloroflexia bacterium]